MVGIVNLIVLNALGLACLSILRAGAFSKGNVFSSSPTSMHIYRRGVESGAFVPNHNWSSTGERRSASIKRWLVFFPKMTLAQFASWRFWGWCSLQALAMGIFWLLLTRENVG